MTQDAGPLTVPQAIRTRRSIRHYLPDPVPERQLAELIDLALEAPSSWNVQARFVVAVSDDEGRAALTRATGGQPHPREAPVTLVFVASGQAWREDLSDIYDRARRNGAWSERSSAASPGPRSTSSGTSNGAACSGSTPSRTP